MIFYCLMLPSTIAEKFCLSYDMLASTVVHVDTTGKHLYSFVQKNISASSLINWGNGVIFAQPGCWLWRRLIENVGYVCCHFHYAFKYLDFLIRYLDMHSQVIYTDASTVCFRMHELSKTMSQSRRFN